MTSYRKPNGKRFIGASRRTAYVKRFERDHLELPTLTEQGVDLDRLLETNKDMIERCRKGIGYEE